MSPLETIAWLALGVGVAMLVLHLIGGGDPDYAETLEQRLTDAEFALREREDLITDLRTSLADSEDELARLKGRNSALQAQLADALNRLQRSA